MRSHQIALVLGLGAVIACGVAADHEPSRIPSEPPAAGSTSAAAPDAHERVEQMKALLRKNGRALDATTYRTIGTADTPDLHTQIQQAMLAHRGQVARPKADWNVPTGAPVRSGVATYGDGFVSPSNNDEVAFAVDNTNGAAHPGISSGITSGPSTAVKNSTLFVLDNVYGSGGGPGTTPRLIYYNNNASTLFGLSALVYSVNSANVQLFALDTTANLWCYKVPENPASPPIALTAQPDCAGWTSASFATTGNAVAWSSPYPVYDPASGDVVRVYFTDDHDELSCVKIGTTTSPAAPATCFTPTAAPGNAIAGPPAVVSVGANQWVIYFGDENCNFYQALDNNGVLTLNTANTACLGTNAGANGKCTPAQSATKCEVHSSPIIDLTNNDVYVASNSRVYQFPLATSSTLPTWAATHVDTLPSSGSQPIDGSPTFGDSGSFIYVATNNTLYSMAYPFASNTAAASVALFKAPTANYIIDTLTINKGSFPLGAPFTYYGSVFVNTSFGGLTTVTTNAVAPAGESGGLEQYSGSSPPVFEQVTTTSSAGTAVATGEIIDWENGNIYFGYDNGNTNATTSGTGGLVQYGASATVPNTSEGWACLNPPFSTSGSSCVYTSGTTSPNCRNTADCTSNTNFGMGYVCTNQGNSPGFQCVKTITCGKSSHCTTANGAPMGATTCDLSLTDPSYGTCVACSGGCPSGEICDTTSDADTGTCVQCNSVNQAECTASGKMACDFTTGSPNFNTCVQCSANNTTTCTASGKTACDTTSGSANFDVCVQCAANNTATCTSPGATKCDTGTGSTKFDSCVQCYAGDTSACMAGAVCDTNPADFTFDTCVVCAPADGSVNSTCQSSNPNFPLCISFDGVPSCGQCTTANESTICPLGLCASDGHCACDSNGGTTGQCPTGTTCNQPSPPSFGECD